MTTELCSMSELVPTLYWKF